MRRYLVGLLGAVLVANISSMANAAIETETKLTMPIVQNTRGAAFSSVSCISELNCIAVGYQEVYFSKFSSSATVRQTLAMSWNGKRWAVTPTPNLGLNETNALTSVSCTSTGFCKATGVWHKIYPDVTSRKVIERPLAMSWDGTSWSLDNTTSFPDFSFIREVSCISQSSCFAVGMKWKNKTPTSSRGSYPVPTILKWDGASWIDQVIPLTNDQPPVSDSQLTSISCASSLACMAVGDFKNVTQEGRQPLSLFWNGADWVTHFPSLSVNNSSLQEVSCSSQMSCMAVGGWGTTTTTSAEQNLVVSWNGNSWTQLPVPTLNPFRRDVLYSVSCRAPNECLAVGVSDGALKSLVWDGGVWSIIQTPKDWNKGGWFSVSCVSSSFCMTVGNSSSNFEFTGNPVAVLLGPFLMKSKVNKTLTPSLIAKAGNLSTPKGSKIVLLTSVKHRKVCKLVQNTIKTVGRGTCPVTIEVTMRNKKKTSTSLNIKVM